MTGEAFPLIVLDAGETSVRGQADVGVAGATAFRGVRTDSAGVTLPELSHEMRTPLNSVLVLSQLMRDGKAGGLTVEQEQYLDIIQRNGQHLVALLDDTVDLVGIEAGRLPLDRRPIDVVAEVRAAVKTVRPVALVRGVEIIVEEDRPWPAFRGDAGRFRRALVNLAAGVIRSTNEGRILLGPGAVAGALPTSIQISNVGFRDGGQGTDTGDLGVGARTGNRTGGATVAMGHAFGLGVVIGTRLLRLMGGDVRGTQVGGDGLKFAIVMPSDTSVPSSGT